MNIKKLITATISHGVVGLLGFAIGIYTLPILTAPPSPTEGELIASNTNQLFTTTFDRKRLDSDTLHWGEGSVSLGNNFITLMGNLAPGPNYKLYLSKSFVETERDFNRLKDTMVVVGDIYTFENFIVNVPKGINVEDYNTVIVWCESFGEYITSAKYQ